MPNSQKGKSQRQPLDLINKKKDTVGNRNGHHSTQLSFIHKYNQTGRECTTIGIIITLSGSANTVLVPWDYINSSRKQAFAIRCDYVLRHTLGQMIQIRCTPYV